MSFGNDCFDDVIGNRVKVLVRIVGSLVRVSLHESLQVWSYGELGARAGVGDDDGRACRDGARRVRL